MDIKALYNSEFHRPLQLTDLCDDVLLKIFSYLDSYDSTIVIPSVCKRFQNTICENNISIKSMSSKEFETKKWRSQGQGPIVYRKVFEKIGKRLTKFKVNSIQNQFEIKLMLKVIGRHCLNLSELEITANSLNVSFMKQLPKTLKQLSINGYGIRKGSTSDGSSLDIGVLKRLEILHLSTYVVPDEIKIAHRLKDFHLNLELSSFPNVDKINELTASISDKSEVVLNLTIYYENIRFDLLDKIMNLKLVILCGPGSTVAHLSSINVSKLDPARISDLQMYCNCKHAMVLTIQDLKKVSEVRMFGMLRYDPKQYLEFESSFGCKVDRLNFFKSFGINCGTSCYRIRVEIFLK